MIHLSHTASTPSAFPSALVALCGILALTSCETLNKPIVPASQAQKSGAIIPTVIIDSPSSQSSTLSSLPPIQKERPPSSSSYQSTTTIPSRTLPPLPKTSQDFSNISGWKVSNPTKDLPNAVDLTTPNGASIIPKPN